MAFKIVIIYKFKKKENFIRKLYMKSLEPKNIVFVKMDSGADQKLKKKKKKIRQVKQSENYSNSSRERKKNGKHGNEQKSYTKYDEKAELPGNWSHRRERLHGFSLSEETVHAGN